MAEQNEIKNEIRNEISDNVGGFTGVSKIEDFLVNNCIENGNINYKKRGQEEKSILEFSLGIGAVEYVDYLLREKNGDIEITQEDFNLAVENGYYYIANKMKSLNNSIDSSDKLSEENYKFGKDYFCEKEFYLRKKINCLIGNNEILNIISKLGEKIQNAKNGSAYFINEINALISTYSNSESMSDANRKKYTVNAIIKILISSEQEEDINIIYDVLGLGDSTENNNDNEIRDLVKELRELCSSNCNKIEKLFNDYVFKQVVVDGGDENSNNIGTVQSEMADAFKEGFNSYVERICLVNSSNDTKSANYNPNMGNDYSSFTKYLNNEIDKDYLNSNPFSEMYSEIDKIITLLGNGQSYDDSLGILTYSTDDLLKSREGGRHYILKYKNEYLDDSEGTRYNGDNNNVHIDNCCGVYFAHMYYIARKIYDTLNIKDGVFSDEEFKKFYKKFREIYVKNANKNGNKDKMKEINCKNRLCIAALNSLQMLEKCISKDKYKELENRIKEEVENSFITEDMKKEFEDLKDYAEKGKIKINKEKIIFKRKYIESFSANSSNNEKTIEKIRNDYYKKKIDKINNLKKSINNTCNSSENKNNINIKDLISSGKISNTEIIGSIYNNKINEFDEEFCMSVLPDANVNDKVYSGFGGKASYDNINKILAVNYDNNGFFCDKLNSINGIDDAIKNNLKKGLKIELKDGCDNEKLVEIFSLLKTNPVLALIELKDISKKIYIGDAEILNDKENFDNLVNVFGITSESRRLIVKLDNSKKINNNNQDYVEIKNCICDILKKALIDNEVAKQIIILTNFKDINIIAGQFLDLFNRIENNDKDLINKFNEEAVNMKNNLEKTNIPNEEKDELMINSFTKCFNIFIYHKLEEMNEKISSIEKQLKEETKGTVNNSIA